MVRNRLDSELVRRGLARSREHGQDLIERGFVKVGGMPATKSATRVAAEESITVNLPADEFASRGGIKLAGALDYFRKLEVEGKRCLDAGASTGGFTDVLLRRGAASVVAVDVGYGQLAWALQQDPRVEVHDRTNIRELQLDEIGASAEMVVADLSFISLKTVLPALISLATSDADFLLMVKPQFEVGKERLGSGGVVREPQLRVSAVLEVAERAFELGIGCLGVTASTLPGPSGNVEYFLWLRRGAPAPVEAEIMTAVEKGPK
ncbi:MAG: TlyA family RNA methyltransferase [Candidatus Nanopelagicaceae bacterium]|nr:TlyA family RNA methyltransferase [Candidatus Nanopelagicaceae bacterium]